MDGLGQHRIRGSGTGTAQKITWPFQILLLPLRLVMRVTAAGVILVRPVVVYPLRLVVLGSLLIGIWCVWHRAWAPALDLGLVALVSFSILIICDAFTIIYDKRKLGRRTGQAPGVPLWRDN